MSKTITIIEIDREHVTDILDNPIKTEMLFREIQRDTIGKSSSNPTWGYTYYYNNGKLKYKGIGLYKEYDYDAPNAAYSEKVWSIIGKNILDNVRVPNIDIVEEHYKEPGIISYRLLDNDKEDLIHIKDILFNKFERTELKEKRNIIYIEDVLECIKLQINDDENYNKIKRNIIQTLLLDAITNNADRHSNNWALIRNKITSEYELADFDHSSSFVDMFEDRRHFTANGWVSSYTSVNPTNDKTKMGSCGDEMIKYISKNYREDFEDFFAKFNDKLPNILQEIRNENLDIDMQRLEQRLNDKKRFLKQQSKEEGEIEYE